MPIFTSSARARRDDGRADIIQLVVIAYICDHAVILLTDAVERHNHRTRWGQQLPMFELMRSSVIERPESCVLTPASARFVNMHNGNFYGADANASLYRHAAS